MYMDFLSSINTKNVKGVQLSGTTHRVGDCIIGDSSILNICGQNSPTTSGKGGTIIVVAGAGGATKGCGGDLIITAGYSNSGSTNCGGGDAYVCGGSATIGKGGDIFIMSGEGDSTNNTGDVHLYRGNSTLVLASTPEGNICVPKYICALSGICSPTIYDEFKGTTFSGTCVCATSCVKTAKLHLTSVSAKTIETAIAFLNANGCIVSGTTTAGMSWAGNTANGIGTYVSSTSICSQPNLTFDGTSLSITGNLKASTYVCSPIITGSTRICSPIVCGTSCTQGSIVCATTCVRSPIVCSTGALDAGTCVIVGTNVIFDTGAARCITWGTAATTGYDLLICAQNGASTSAGGNLLLCGGLGGATSGNGGVTYLLGGSSTNGTGGSVIICAGTATTGTGGNVSIVGGNGSSTDGCVALCVYNAATENYALLALPASCTVLYYAGAAKLCTVTNGICLGTNCGFATDFVATSDIRIKKDIVPISNALSMVNQLQGVCYHLCDDCECEVRIGLIAQDVEKIIPEVVSHSIPSEEDVKYGIIDNKLGLKYDKLTAVLIEAIKEQQIQIAELKTEINRLKEK